MAQRNLCASAAGGRTGGIKVLVLALLAVAVLALAVIAEPQPQPQQPPHEPRTAGHSRHAMGTHCSHMSQEPAAGTTEASAAADAAEPAASDVNGGADAETAAAEEAAGGAGTMTAEQIELALFGNTTGRAGRRKLATSTCDYRKGQWQYTESYQPLYTDNCPFIRSGFNCQKNGRSDTNYVKYRWKPSACSLPPFDVGTFLPMMRDKTIAFIGDSISRNFQQSISCQLAAREKVSDWSGFLNGQFTTGLFLPNYNIRLLAFISPFLVRYSNNKNDFAKYGLSPPSSKQIQDGNGGAQGYVVWTDKLDPAWTDMLPSVDVAVFMSGHWFLSSQGRTDVRSLTYISKEKPVAMTGLAAYSKAMKKVISFVDTKFKGVGLWLSYTPSHYNKGNPPTCDYNSPNTPQSPIADQSAVSFNKQEKTLLKKSTRIDFMDLTYMMALRPDGHVQKYYGPSKNSKTKWDCLHWCLPGVPDAWSDVLQLILKSKFGK